MEIPLLTNQVHKAENADFIKEVSNVVEFIFATDHSDENFYLMSDGSNIDEPHYNIRRPGEDPFTSEDAENDTPHIDLNGLGPLEKDLLLRLKNARYKTIVFSGGLGSGKSTIARYVLGQITGSKRLKCDACTNKNQCHNKTEIQITIDFNKKFDGVSSYAAIMRSFKSELNIQIKKALRRIFATVASIDDMITALREYEGGESETWQEPFMSFLVEKVDVDPEKWTPLKPGRKIDILFAWIDAQERSAEARLPYLTNIFTFVRSRYPEQLKGCLIAFFDNIDHLPARCQTNIVTYLDRFTENANVRTLIPVRLTTYGRVKDVLGARPFGRYQHAPPRATKVIHGRIKAMLKATHHAQWKDIKPLTHTLVTEKLRALNSFLEPGNEQDRLADCINALAGSSVRRGLFLTERAIKNFAFKHNDREAWKSPDAFIKALLVGQSLTGRMKVSDEFVANVFTGSSQGHPSLICIRILQLLASTWRHQIRYEMVNLVKDLRRFFPYTDDQILHALQYLMSLKRRLVFIAGTPALEEVTTIDILNSPTEIEITQAGKLYVEHLLGDLTYGQECFMSLDWDMNEIRESTLLIRKNVHDFIRKTILKGKHAHVMDQQLNELFAGDVTHDELRRIFSPIANTTFDRLQVVRKAMTLFARMEILQLLSYRYNTKDDPLRRTTIQGSIISPALGRMAVSVFNILRKSEDIHKDNELRDWYNLCLIMYNIERIVFEGADSAELTRAINNYSRLFTKRDND